MTYTQLIEQLSTPLVDKHYYSLLLDNATAIVIEASTTSKSKVAKELGMSPQVFATAYKFISSRV